MASEIKEADSPASQLNRADLRPAPSAANSNKLYLFFWHAYSPVMYALYEIDVPIPLPSPPTKAAQDAEIKKPRPLFPILNLKTGEYPDRMSCVQLGSKLYFFGGEFNIDDPYIDEEVKKNLKEKRDVFPRDVYFFDLDTHNISDKPLDKLQVHETRMNSGKASPYAFVANEKIYVVGSTIEMNISDRSKMKDLNLESFRYFEDYDPETKKWDFLPNPTIGDVKTKWVGHAVVGSKALLVAWQLGKESLYCFDLCAEQWTKYAGLPSYPGNFSGRIEYVEDTLYGCYHSTIAAIAPLAKEEEVKEKEKEKEVKEEEEEEAEEFKHHCLHLVSEDAIFNVPPQLDSSSSLLHLVNRQFCYVRTGMPLDLINGSDHAMDDTRRYISIVIFRALRKTYKKDSTRLFPAEFLHSAHYVVDTPFSNEGFLEGCFSPGWKYRTARHRPESSEGTSEKNLTPIEEAKSVDIKTQREAQDAEFVKSLRSHPGKRRRMNMKIEEPSQKVEPNRKEVGQASGFIQFTECNDFLPKVEWKSPPKLDKIALKCGHPYSSSEYIDFEAAPRFCGDKRNYNLVSDLPSEHYIRRHNPQKYAVLTHKKYKTTLEQWLKEKRNKDNWCPNYQKWNVNRPKEEARQIIQGILCAVNEFHSNDCFHGCLYHPENYAIHYDVALIGGDHKKIKRISLIYENVEVDECFGVPNINEIEWGQKNDIKALSNVIFTKILGGKPTSCYPEDLKDLHNLFEKCNCKRNWKHYWKCIVNHPSLWHWKSRFSYIERVWMQYWHANPTLKPSMDNEFRNIDVRNWKQNIPSNTHLEKMFRRNNYKSTPDELLRYLRNVHVHYKDDLDVSVQDVDYLNEQFIEQKTTEVSELFLVHLYNKMRNLDIEL